MRKGESSATSVGGDEVPERQRVERVARAWKVARFVVTPKLAGGHRRYGGTEFSPAHSAIGNAAPMVPKDVELGIAARSIEGTRGRAR